MKKLGLLLCLLVTMITQMAYGQNRKITGRVLDQNGEGIPSAGISVKGNPSIGTVTDVDGNFALNLPDNSYTLVIQSIGFASQEYNITDNDQSVTVRLAPAARTLEETVVTANAIRREKRSLGYATTQVTGAELTAGGNISPINALVGKAAGVNITSANASGASSRIVLRGGSSLTGNNQALIVVDGVPINNYNYGTSTSSGTGTLSNQVDYGNRGNDINPDDIESVTVLKGPAATALYGAIASNGALMITTKKGRRKAADGPNKTAIEVSSAYEMSTILKLPEFQNTYGQGNIYEGIEDDRRENFSWGNKFDGQLRPWGQVINGQQKVKPYEAQKNNIKDFFDMGQTWNNNIAFNGGNEDAAYRLSVGSVNSKSVFPGSRYDKYNVGFNGNANLTHNLYTSVSLNYIKINSVVPGLGQKEASVLDNLYQTPRDIPIRELRDLNDVYNSMDYVDQTGTHRYGYYGAYALNPYYVLKNFQNFNRVDRLLGNAVIGWQALKWLKVENRISTDLYADRRYQQQPKFDAQPFDPLYTGLPHTFQGRYNQDIYNITNIFNDLMLTFDKDIAKDFHLTWLVAHNFSQYRTENVFSSVNEEGGLVIPGYYDLRNSNGIPLTTNDFSLIRRRGIYTDASFSYKNRLFFGVNARNDKSSTIANSYTYYGANASFILSELFPNKMREYWNYSKLRVSFGSVGNDAGPYLNQTVYNKAEALGGFGSTVFPFNGVAGFTYDGRIGNPALQPEFSREFEIGTEQSFWSNRLTLDVSYYSKRSENQIISVPIATSSGFSSNVINTGLMVNNGIELAVRVTPVQTKTGFKWELYGTYTKNNNNVKEIYTGVDQIQLGGLNGMSVVAAVNKPYGTFYTVGHEFTADGKIIVDSATGIPTVSKVAQYYGTYLPDYQASLGTTLSYKGLSLNLLFDTKQGGQFFTRSRDVMGFVGTSKESENRDDQVWANSVYMGADGAYHTNTTKYSPYTYYTSAGLRPESEFLVNATYVKLREASISYLFPKKWFDKTWVGGGSLSVYGNNLIIWTPSSNKYADPEMNSGGATPSMSSAGAGSAGNTQGFDFSAQPSLKRYGIRLKFTF